MKITDLIKIKFVDINPDVITAYSKQFKNENCDFKIGNILSENSGTLVSPANCRGNMDGGIDNEYSHKFQGLEDRLRSHIKNIHGNKLKIGVSLIVPTYDEKFPYVVFSPTVESPGDLTTEENVYKASKALFKEIVLFNMKDIPADKKIKQLLIPGMGTYYGGLSPQVSAQGVYRGYDETNNNLSKFFNG